MKTKHTKPLTQEIPRPLHLREQQLKNWRLLLTFAVIKIVIDFGLPLAIPMAVYLATFELKLVSHLKTAKSQIPSGQGRGGQDKAQPEDDGAGGEHGVRRAAAEHQPGQ